MRGADGDHVSAVTAARVATDARHSPMSGTEVGSILTARRVTILVVSVAIVLLHALDTWGNPEHGSLATAALAVALVVPVLLTARPWAQWSAVAAVVVTALSALATAPGEPSRVNESTTIFVAAYFGVVLSGRRWGAAWIVAMLVTWVAVPGTVPLTVTLDGTTVNIRWITLLQLAVSSAWLWWTWATELPAAAARDDSVRASDEGRLTAIAARERVRIWRDAAVRTHETLLNNIRYVLSTSAIDAEALAAHLESEQASSAPPSGEVATARSLVDDVARAEGLSASIQYVGDQIAVDPACVPALRSALVEFTRNAHRHGDARHVTVRGSARPDAVLHLRHDGRPVGDGASAAGIGTRIVLAESLHDVSIAVVEHPDGVDLLLPARRAADPWLTREVPDAGRTVLATVTAANAVGGSLYALALAAVGGLAALAAAVATLAVTALGMRAAWQRRRASATAVIVAAVLAAAVPLFALPAGRECGSAELAVIVAVLAGLALSAVVSWAPGVGWWAWAAPWAIGVVLLGVSLPEQCRVPANASLGTAVVPAFFAGVIYVSLGRANRRADAADLLRIREARETAAADATVELGAQLDAAVLEAESLIRSLADGAPFDDDTRTRLRCLDGQIRAALQVDPARSGGMARSAQALVRRCTEAGVPVRVLYLGGTSDPRPLPEGLLDLLARVLLADTEGTAVLQLVDAPDEDTLVLTVSAAAARRAGVDLDWTYAFDDGHAEIDTGDSDGEFVFLIERTARSDRRRAD